ncbi:hypothetical protein JW823_05280 [bacterium]|nr:hypothetical protein [candidate division CSSED10-310 bacterium]
MRFLNTIRSLRLMIINDFLRLNNHYRANGISAVFATTAIILLATFFILVEYFVAEHLFQHIMNQVHLEGLRYVLLAKLLQMVFLIFSVLLVYSNIIMSISSYFLSPEIDLLHTHPISDKVLFIYSFFETFIRSSWMFIAFGLPILLAYGVVLNQAGTFVSQIGLIVIPMLILPAALGVFAGVLLIYVFSPRRTQRVFLIMGICLAVGLVLVFRLMRPEQLVDPIGVEQVNFYLDTLRIPSISWLPTTWASEGFSAYGEGRGTANLYNAQKLWVAAGFSLLLAYISFKIFWWRARSRGQDSDIIELDKNDKKREATPANHFRCSLMYRDMILFRRDAGQWSQIIVIAALVIIYIFNFKNLPYELYGFQYGMSFVSVFASGLILSALLARFGFPAVSMEGRAIWILKTSPINWRRYLWHKYLFLVIPALTIGSILVLFSVRVLDGSSILVLKCLLTEAAIAVSCTGLAIGIGARRPRFNLNDAAMVTVSAPGLWYMILAVLTICVTVGLVVLPDLLRYMSYGWRWLTFIRHADRIVVWFIVLLLVSCATLIPMESGIRHLKRMAEK